MKYTYYILFCVMIDYRETVYRILGIERCDCSEINLEKLAIMNC